MLLFQHVISAAWFLLVSGQNCRDNMKNDLLIPNYISEGTDGDLQVVYPGNSTVTCGGQMPITKTMSAPTVTYDVPDKCANVSVVLFDPDTPLPCGIRIYLHWFAVNIPAKVMKSGYQRGQAGFEVAPYITPGAPTANHRYTICVYCQNSYIPEKPAYADILTRMGVHPKSLVQQYGLGDSLACTYMYLTLFNFNLPFVNDHLINAGNRDKTWTCKSGSA